MKTFGIAFYQSNLSTQHYSQRLAYNNSIFYQVYNDDRKNPSMLHILLGVVWKKIFYRDRKITYKITNYCKKIVDFETECTHQNTVGFTSFSK
jgi:hypothetical protein